MDMRWTGRVAAIGAVGVVRFVSSSIMVQAGDRHEHVFVPGSPEEEVIAEALRALLAERAGAYRALLELSDQLHARVAELEAALVAAERREKPLVRFNVGPHARAEHLRAVDLRSLDFCITIDDRADDQPLPLMPPAEGLDVWTLAGTTSLERPGSVFVKGGRVQTRVVSFWARKRPGSASVEQRIVTLVGRWIAGPPSMGSGPGGGSATELENERLWRSEMGAAARALLREGHHAGSLTSRASDLLTVIVDTDENPA